MRRGILVCVAVLAVVTASAGFWIYSWYRQPGPLSAPITLVLPKGAGVDAFSARLAQAGVIDRPRLFAIVARATRGRGRIRAGEYAIPGDISPEALLALLRSGKTVVHRLTVPEGLTTAEVLTLIERAEGLQGSVTDPPAEGQLFPSTYFYSWGDARQALVDRMRRTMERTLDELWRTRKPNVPLSDPEAAVILASIVEKETALAAERPKVAGVFYNRLHTGMKLQSDPTVAYALTGGQAPLGRPVEHADLDTASPYNTYFVAGLPPGPIDNPGRASLEAVLNPADTDALYFVADGSGGHVFSATLETHNKNVAHWRKLEKSSRP